MNYCSNHVIYEFCVHYTINLIYLNPDKTHRTITKQYRKTQTLKHAKDRRTDKRQAIDNNHNN